jgi:hypothetical protein
MTTANALARFEGVVLVPQGVPLVWRIAGVGGDLDGDGESDLIWRQTQSGDVAAWLMGGQRTR